MNKISAKPPFAIGKHHSLLPLAVQACFRQLTVHKRRQFYPHQIQSILVRAVNWLGDAILTLPAIRQLKRFFPQARLSILALERVAPVFLQQPEVAEIIPYLPKPPASSLRDWLESIYPAAAKTVRSGRYFSQFPGIRPGGVAAGDAPPGGLQHRGPVLPVDPDSSRA